MANSTPVTRQTSKEVKRAYKQRSNASSVSEVERRRLERAAELDRRAERIKEREQNKRVTAQKKAEKETFEREKRKRMGIPEPITKVSSSQRHIGDFLRSKSKNRSEEELQKDLAWAKTTPNVPGNANEVLVGEREKSPPNTPTSSFQRLEAQNQKTPLIQQEEVARLAANASANVRIHLPEIVLDQDLENMFASNSQIQRDLASSPPDSKHSSITSASKRTPRLQATNPNPANSLQNTASEACSTAEAGNRSHPIVHTATTSFSELLQGISTQDFENISSSPVQAEKGQAMTASSCEGRSRSRSPKAANEEVAIPLSGKATDPHFRVEKHLPSVQAPTDDKNTRQGAHVPNSSPVLILRRKEKGKPYQDTNGEKVGIRLPDGGWIDVKDLRYTEEDLKELLS